jgi:formiminotetrahydrofolate cyclodeaminase
VTYADSSVEAYLSAVASAQVAPSAGATTALTGAMAAALCEMVCIHTSESETPARLADAHAELRTHRDRLLALADDDAAAVETVQTAFEAETNADHERAALEAATDIPLDIAETARDVADCAVVVAADGTGNARTDAVVGVTLAQAAVVSAAAIVRDNLGLLDESQFVKSSRRRIQAAESDAAAAVASVTDN